MDDELDPFITDSKVVTGDRPNYGFSTTIISSLVASFFMVAFFFLVRGECRCSFDKFSNGWETDFGMYCVPSTTSV